ncbi:anamorsin homolog isoform X2 [Belonocnema kinseyi]|uniref:anamorsin homolog isoform X2 n=1 Tax=Belonocnema kinseyi TaxID=2817044 RepID=UPI00143D6C6B|nr:anamorsin homolog isoform X2 [Belonocnema kinseyi]
MLKMSKFVKQSDKVLVVSSDKTSDDSGDLIANVKKAVGDTGETFLENVDNFLNSNHSPSSIDVIISGFGNVFVLNNEALKKSLQILKPKGVIVLRESIKELKKTNIDQISKLKLNGFRLKTSESEHDKMGDEGETDVCVVVAEKPSYEIGSSVPLSFAESSGNVWKLDDDIDNNLIDEDDLLDESDIAKPDVSSLRVCSTTGKRRACKDCSCGLADELKGSVSEQVEKSSCGSCYLGDAFRCASCPYLGMPAFKPGEKIILSDSQLVNL